MNKPIHEVIDDFRLLVKIRDDVVNAPRTLKAHLASLPNLNGDDFDRLDNLYSEILMEHRLAIEKKIKAHGTRLTNCETS